MSMNSFHARTARPKSKVAVRAASQVYGAKSSARAHGMRLDALLVLQGLAPSRTAAQRLIEAGCVSLDGTTLQKSSQLLPETAALVLVPTEA